MNWLHVLKKMRSTRTLLIATAVVAIGGVVAGAADMSTVVDTAKSSTDDHHSHHDVGPFPNDFVDIRQVSPHDSTRTAGQGGSNGTATIRCGRDENGHHNSDNFIAQPGVEMGAEHLHDYVGNVSTDANSTDKSLARADTTCDGGDQSTYFWPVVRIQDQNGSKAVENNIGRVLEPKVVDIQYRGNPVGDVTPMPKFLRILYGDAKVLLNGRANARPSWTCTGFEDRVTAKYPLCPTDSEVERVHDFPSCWDGKHLDSDDHRSHIVFPDDNGSCRKGFKATPQLRVTLVYDIPAGARFAVDSFPEENHSPLSDHDDFENVMPAQLMDQVVGCINDGRSCSI